MRMTEEEYAQLLARRSKTAEACAAPARKPPKYRNTRCQSHDGKHFDSKLERDYYEQLVLRWRAGEVRWFIRQVPFELEGGVVYRADFLVVTATGDIDVVDTTGVMTQAKTNKLKQVKERWGIEVRLVRSV